MTREDALKKIDELKAFVEDCGSHEEPELVYCLMLHNAQFETTVEGVSHNVKLSKIKDGKYTKGDESFDLILKSADGYDSVWLGRWNDGPKEQA